MFADDADVARVRGERVEGDVCRSKDSVEIVVSYSQARVSRKVGRLDVR